ncbi:hypothetical protein K3495_g8136 [Podosphaera aphanis]|nr:hypothetical protein K3495_g8136 [Podosphaera aphanis]
MAYQQPKTTITSAETSHPLSTGSSRPQIRTLKPLNNDYSYLNSFKNRVKQSPIERPDVLSTRIPSLESNFRLQTRPRTRTGIIEDGLNIDQQSLSSPCISPLDYASSNSEKSNTPSLPSNSMRQTSPGKPQSPQTRILVKKSSLLTSNSPVVSDDARSVNSFELPANVADSDKIRALMKTLCGRMRSVVEYRTNDKGSFCGLCFIDNVKGSLMYKGYEKESVLVTVIDDLRGIQVEQVESEDKNTKWLVLSDRLIGSQVHLKPIDPVEYDLWLAALLCWQQARLPTGSNRSSPGLEKNSRPRESSLIHKSNGMNVGKIIKVAKLLLWDKVLPSSPSSKTIIIPKKFRRDSGLAFKSNWRQVSCILHDNGDFKLLTEDNNPFVPTINLSHFPRSSIQLLDESVLNEEFCVGIFPQYATIPNQPSISEPLYIAFESRLSYEAWFCLLRAFTFPEIYVPRLPKSGQKHDDLGVLNSQLQTKNMFRVEKSLKLRIIEAKIRKPASKLKLSSSGKSVKEEPDASTGNYFAEVLLEGEIRARTSIRNDTKNPFWREDCEFRNLPPRPPRLKVAIKKVKGTISPAQGSLSPHNHLMNASPETFCCTAEILLSSLDPGKDDETWWPVLDHDQERIGEILLVIKYEELVVLLGNDYQPISKLLHNFGSGLTIQISQAIPSNLKILSETMMNIFQVTGCAGEWLTTLVEEEIDGPGKDLSSDCRIIWSKRGDTDQSLFSVTTVSDREQSVRDMGKTLQVEANLLFRGNSLLTQALDFHMRRVGKDYLADVLTGQISEINSMNPDCEVDPSRISNAHDRNKNWSLLFTLATNVWESISSSAARFPSELRRVLKYIRAVAEDRYGDFLRTVAYTSVSGILFLRFFCPALLNPKLFGLLKDNPQAKAQRTLTLIAKGLQALANFSNFGKKEAWMEPMNQFLAVHRKGMKGFIDSICAISSQEISTSLPASYSSPATVFSRLPPTYREGFPSLPYLIDHAQNFSKLVKLWLDAQNKITTPTSLQGELLVFHQLCLKLQSRADEYLRQAEQVNQHGGQNLLQSNTRMVNAMNSCDILLDESELKDSPRTSLSTNSSDRIRTPQDLCRNNGNEKTGPAIEYQKQSISRSFKSHYDEQDLNIFGSNSPIIELASNNESIGDTMGGNKRRGRENGALTYENTHENFISASWAGGFV